MARLATAMRCAERLHKRAMSHGGPYVTVLGNLADQWASPAVQVAGCEAATNMQC